MVLVRHAETAPDGSRDPGLSAEGHERARRLSALVGDGELRAVYATEYRRTQETAAPVAEGAGVDVTVVPYGAGPLDGYAAAVAALVRQDLADDPGGVVLVVGHSNTVPALAEALAGQPVAPIGEAEYDRVVRVRLRSGGASLEADGGPGAAGSGGR